MHALLNNTTGNGKRDEEWVSWLSQKRTRLMGILNITPDSFSDGGLFSTPASALEQAKKMQAAGAHFLDIGAESSRPGSTPVDATVELNRLLPILETLLPEISIPISVDTYKAQVASPVLKMGVPIINDIGGLQRDQAMAATIAQYDAGVIVMHNSIGTDYKEDIMDSLIQFFNRSIEIALAAGIDSKKIILDPGIGFGKTTEQNLELLARMKELKPLGYPLLLGASRKSVIGNTLGLPTHERLEGTLATTTCGIINGAKIIRVHDVEANQRAAAMTDAIINYKNNG